MPYRRSLVVVLIYLVAGWLWITFSDFLVAMWFRDPDQMSRVQTWKGVAFVLVTALALFLSLVRQFRKDRERLELASHQQKRIRELNQFRESVIDNANVWINVLDSGGRVVLWNRIAEQISGYSRDEVVGNERIWTWLYPDPDYRQRILDRIMLTIANGEDLTGYETTITNRSGEQRLISWNSRSFREDHRLTGSIAIGHDITDMRQAEQRLQQRERQLATLMDNLPGMAYRCLYDPYWTMKFISSGCTDLTGYEPEELLDNRDVCFADLMRASDGDAVLHAVEVAIGNAEPFSVEYMLTRKDGREIWVWERGRAVEDESGLVLEGIILDISERKTLEQELAEMATSDALTGLFNRRETSRLLDEEIARAHRYQRSLALMWIDLDYFKAINDRHGHAAGDAVLQSVSEHLVDSVRGVDIVGRFGGEEFVVVLPETREHEAMETAERLRERIGLARHPLGNGETISLTASIGVALYPIHGADAGELSALADQAMYRAKAGGRNRVEMGVPDEESEPKVDRGVSGDAGI